MTDIREQFAPYDQAVADELREVAASIGGSDSISGLMILGLVDEYEMAPGGPRAQLRRPDIREEFARIADALKDFDAFLNEPPQYEDKRMVRDYRHEAYGKWKILRVMLLKLVSHPLPSVCGGEGWRPIETAPKDGTRLLLWSPDATIDNPYIGHWCDREDYPDGGAWWEKDDNEGFCADADPTFWMDVPPPPGASPSPPPVSAREESIRNARAAMEPFADDGIGTRRDIAALRLSLAALKREVG